MESLNTTHDQVNNPEPEREEKARTPEPSRTRRRSLFADPVPWSLLLLTLGLDQLTKALVVANLSRGESWPEEGFVRITHAWNTGTAFSLFQDQGTLLTIFSFVAVAALYFVYRSLDTPGLRVRMAFGLLLGGAFGNLIDRLRLGHVTDFMDVGPWPIFNVADSSIVIGIAVLFLTFWAASDRKTEKPASDEPSGRSGTQDTASND